MLRFATVKPLYGGGYSVETLGRVKNNMRELERKLEEQAARGLNPSQMQSDVEAVRAENAELEEQAHRARRARV
jgi:hypothetical protein